MTAELSDQLRSIALHESGHTIVALALCISVKRVYMTAAYGAVRGQTECCWPPGTKRSRLVAMLCAGVLASNNCTHLQLFVPPPDVVCEPPDSTAARREMRALKRFRFNQTAVESGSTWSGDLGTIKAVLAGCKHPTAIYSHGESIARACLDRNERLLRSVAQRLLYEGEVSGGALARLAKDVTTYKHM